MKNSIRVLMISVIALTGCHERVERTKPLTIIEDTLYMPDGRLFQGTLAISWQKFYSDNLVKVEAGGADYPIADGKVYIALWPNSYRSTYYTVAFKPILPDKLGHIWIAEQYWIVPPSGHALSIVEVTALLDSAPPL